MSVQPQAKTDLPSNSALSGVSLTELKAWAREYGLTPAELWELSFDGKFPGKQTLRDTVYLMATTLHVRPERILN